MLSQDVDAHFSFITKRNLQSIQKRFVNAYYMLSVGVMKMNGLVPSNQELKTSDRRYKQNFSMES